MDKEKNTNFEIKRASSIFVVLLHQLHQLTSSQESTIEKQSTVKLPVDNMQKFSTLYTSERKKTEKVNNNQPNIQRATTIRVKHIKSPAGFGKWIKHIFQVNSFFTLFNIIFFHINVMLFIILSSSKQTCMTSLQNEDANKLIKKTFRKGDFHLLP